MSRILIKFPTRARYSKAKEVINNYLSFAVNPEDIQVIVSVDQDDQPEKYVFTEPCVKVKVGLSNGKIDAVNRDMPDTSTFDILLLASDDMIPVVKGYDDIIRTKMNEHFPDGDGVLWFNDGSQKNRLNTLVICGSKYYERFGYIYYPLYKSLWCDNEFTEVASILGKQVYFDMVIIKHDHPANNPNLKYDQLYEHNDKFFFADKNLYMRRRINNFRS
jgi:hypothetical protein